MQVLHAINSHGKEYVAYVEQALSADDFDAVASVLDASEKLLASLHQYLLPATRDALTVGAVGKVRDRTVGNRQRALQLITAGGADAEHTDLASLLAAVREASQNKTMLRHVRVYLEGEFPVGEDDYADVTAALNERLIALADALTRQLTRDDAASSFEEAAGSLTQMLAEIDSGEEHLQQHLTGEAKEARLGCRRAFHDFKELAFHNLQKAIDLSTWDDAGKLFRCLKAAAMGTAEEKRTVEARLEGQNIALP